MKYFTLDGWINDQNPDADDTRTYELRDAYVTYLESIKDKLPKEFQRMLCTICIHDGILREFNFRSKHQEFLLTIDAGDITMKEGKKVRLVYLGVDSVVCYADPERGLPGPYGFGDIGVDEIEVLGNGSFEHRVLFSSGIELQIQFEDFILKILTEN